MQRVVRFNLLGVLALAALAACGDKVTIPPTITTSITPPTPQVISVSVTPSTAQMNPGDRITFAATVNADAGITDRTVTWRSNSTTVATVDANTGVVTAVAAGTTTIVATSKANTNVSGAASVTVAAATVTQVRSTGQAG